MRMVSFSQTIPALASEPPGFLIRNTVHETFTVNLLVTCHSITVKDGIGSDMTNGV